MSGEVHEAIYGEVEQVRVTMITPSLPERGDLLHEARLSVGTQTEPVRHLSMVDVAGVGPAAIRNKLLDLVETPFVGFLDDDDILDPEHVEVLMALLENGRSLADMAWSRCRTYFAPGVPVVHVLQPMRLDYDAMFRAGRNWIPVTVLARTESVRQAGCFDPADRYEDFELWRRMHAAGMRFAHHPYVTWTYRFLGENRTHT